MNELQYNNCQDEIARCTRLYKDFSDAAAFVSAVCQVIYNYFKEHPVTPIPAVDEEEATVRMREGKSLDLHPSLRTEDIVSLLKELSAAMLKVNPKLKDIVNQLNERFDSFKTDSPELVTKEKVFELQDSLIKETELEEDLATFLFSFMLFSFYRQFLIPSAEVLRTDLWEGGNCPLCGEKPHYGMLRAEDGAKMLACWLCGTEWSHTRVKCPFCDNTEQEDLGYFTVEGDEKVRVNYCKKCCQYYKLIDVREFHADGDLTLAIHNLASLTHDLLARREGFTPGSGLEWLNKDEAIEAQD